MEEPGPRSDSNTNLLAFHNDHDRARPISKVTVDRSVPYKNELLLSRNIKSSRYETVVLNLRIYNLENSEDPKLTTANMVLYELLANA